jgi:hypothetical protein
VIHTGFRRQKAGFPVVAGVAGMAVWSVVSTRSTGSMRSVAAVGCVGSVGWEAVFSFMCPRLSEER